jgi:hypothetical protein
LKHNKLFLYYKGKMEKETELLYSGLSAEQLTNQKNTLQKELEKSESAKQQLVAKIYALSGAIQQCDMFLNMLDASPASSIPSDNDDAVNTALS